MRHTLPTHPVTGLTALGIVGGRPVWPVMGGNGADPTPEARTGQQEPPTPPAQAPAAPANGPDGFPAETPVAEMTAEQQAAYWRHQSRKHEDRAKKAPTDAELAELRAAADKVKALEDAAKTDLDKATERADTATTDLTQARTDIAARDHEIARLTAAIAHGLPDGVGTRLLAASRRITGTNPDELSADAKDYFTTAPIQPTTPATPPPPPPNPSFDQGPRNTPGDTKPSVDRGRALFESRKKP